MADGLAQPEAIWRSPCLSPGHPPPQGGLSPSQLGWASKAVFLQPAGPRAHAVSGPTGERERQLHQSCSLGGRLRLQMPCVLGHRRPSQVLALHLLPGPPVQLAGSDCFPTPSGKLFPKRDSV